LARRSGTLVGPHADRTECFVAARWSGAGEDTTAVEAMTGHDVRSEAAWQRVVEATSRRRPNSWGRISWRTRT
jgi:hypothetical protein